MSDNPFGIIFRAFEAFSGLIESLFRWLRFFDAFVLLVLVACMGVTTFTRHSVEDLQTCI